MQVRTFIFCILFSVSSFAGDTAKLQQYLLQHRYTIDLNSGHAFDMLPGLMHGKNLFVLGEGGSHELQLYTPLKSAILDQLATQNLKYYFIEFGRSVAYFMNKYLHSEYVGCMPGYENYCAIMDHEKMMLQKGHDFKVVGIDFERRSMFNKDINMLFQQADLEKLPASRKLLSELLDSSYVHYSHKKFMHFYKTERKEFYHNKSDIKVELGNKYTDLEYLLTNNNTTRPNTDRNPKMAKNLLNEIAPLDTSAVYFLSIGMAHSLPNKHYTTVHKLCKSAQLRNKIIVMNVYCSNCTATGEKLDDYSTLSFLNNEDVMTCFSHAADTDLTLFDLSQLPPEFDYMKAYGDLLLFAKNKD